jgi:hypothetical protein
VFADRLSDHALEDPVEVEWREAGHRGQFIEREWTVQLLLNMSQRAPDTGFVVPQCCLASLGGCSHFKERFTISSRDPLDFACSIGGQRAKEAGFLVNEGKLEWDNPVRKADAVDPKLRRTLEVILENGRVTALKKVDPSGEYINKRKGEKRFAKIHLMMEGRLDNREDLKPEWRGEVDDHVGAADSLVPALRIIC